MHAYDKFSPVDGDDGGVKWSVLILNDTDDGI